MSQESSAEIVQEALALGALGYVVKMHAGHELLAAMDAVVQGRQFVGSGVSGPVPASDGKALKHPNKLASESTEITCSHKAEFYPDDAAFVAAFARFIDAGLASGSAVIVVATEPHRKSLLKRLRENGVDVVAAAEEGRYIAVDVADMLSAFMVNNLPDPARFLEVVRNLVDAASKASKGGHPRVVACGECAPSLWVKGNADAAVQVEQLCNEIVRICNIDILCGYVLNSFQREHESHIYEKICAKHSSVSSVG